MAGVDLSVYTFDYDLTFAVLLMNGDGTIYHRYGTRDHASGTSRLSMPSLLRVMRETAADHAAYQKKPSPPKPLPKRTIEEIPPMARKIEGRKKEGKHVECFHCHMVNDSERDHAREQGRWSRDATLAMWPLPDKIGLKLDRDDQALVKEVVAGSPAAAAGIKAADRIVRLGSQHVRTQMDVQWVLENAPGDGATIPVEHLREGDMMMLGNVQLSKGWKVPTDLEFSWRSSMWSLRPQPGFGGQRLGKEELKKLGLDAGTFALKVGYIVDWGDDAEVGRNVRKAGIKKDDVILSAGGKRDFESELHFQSWFRFTQKPGTKVEVELLRDGKREKVELPVLP